MGNKHHLLSPSGAERWLTCPGSLRLCKDLPETTSSYADEGTKAHELAEICLSQNLSAEEAGCIDDLPADMAPAVQIYLNFLTELNNEVEEFKGEPELYVESKEIDEFGGTIDWLCTYKLEGKRILHVVDYKHGAGLPVIVENNPQLLCYLLLAREQFDEPFDEYRASVVQPRITRDVETVSYDFDDLAEFKANILEAKDKDYLSSGDHCRWCKAITECPKLANESLALAKKEFADDLPGEREQLWANILCSGPAIKKLLEELPKRMLEEMKKGVKFPGCKAVKSLGNRSWSDSQDEVVDKLKRKKGIKLDDFYPRTLKTPTQLSKAGFGDKIEEFVVRKDKGYSVVPETSRGKAVDLSPPDEFDFLD